MCLNSAVLSKFSNKFHRVQNLKTDGIQEVSGSIPLISTIEALKTIGFQGFLLLYSTSPDGISINHIFLFNKNTSILNGIQKVYDNGNFVLKNGRNN